MLFTQRLNLVGVAFHKVLGMFQTSVIFDHFNDSGKGSYFLTFLAFPLPFPPSPFGVISHCLLEHYSPTMSRRYFAALYGVGWETAHPSRKGRDATLISLGWVRVSDVRG